MADRINFVCRFRQQMDSSTSGISLSSCEIMHVNVTSCVQTC